MKERISLLVPFRTDNAERRDAWVWLKRYWQHELPDAEIVVGHDIGGRPFSKTNAINQAAKRAKGDIFVILDADTYISGRDITHAVNRIRQARNQDVPLWFVPYRHIYRLTQEASTRVLASDPKDPLRFSEPPDNEDVEDTTGSLFGHKFGALIMIVPREAFELVGCMDPRFRGWGGEDVSFLRALDTLYVKHKNTPNDVLHLWHPRHGQVWSTRTWDGQERPRANDWLAIKYNRATNKPEMMRQLVDAGCVSVPVSVLSQIRHVFWDFWQDLRSLWHRLASH